MKKLQLIALAIPVLLAGCTSKCIEDSGVQVTKVVELKSYDKIKVSGTIKLILTQDSTYNVKIQADSNVVPLIRSRVSGSELELKLENGKYCGTDSIVVYAGIGDLKELETSGMVRVIGESPIYVKDLDLDLQGGSDVTLNLNASKLSSKIDGVGKLTLTGQTGTHIVKTSGNAKLDAFSFVAGIYDINIEGTGKANINVLNDLKVKTSGVSEVFYKGNPKNVTEKKSGVSKLEKVN
ncbi:head GIN domain-containing protein [Pedobacter gandavensis]|uniref:DUF2807 domain-containing protein n=1 Tax=Pedobacter gandavensis TaxID=2679963 RepID=A0ABR6ETA5_9SPHI|nr:head GIN domain-containing protein [Pedobacter gandavensis]MBB2148502.1 DUF2807 domain-containing protein [Pedobacter gandavensis]